MRIERKDGTFLGDDDTEIVFHKDYEKRKNRIGYSAIAAGLLFMSSVISSSIFLLDWSRDKHAAWQNNPLGQSDVKTQMLDKANMEFERAIEVLMGGTIFSIGIFGAGVRGYNSWADKVKTEFKAQNPNTVRKLDF